jgi:oligopeptide transport system ATP-binding protein
MPSTAATARTRPGARSATGHDTACFWNHRTRAADMSATPGGRKLVEVRGLKMHFPIVGGLLRRQVGAVKAVDGVSFDIYEGETLGVVGESGCGKSTCGRAVLRLYDITEGSIRIDGTEIGKMSQTQLRRCARRCRWCSRTRRPASIPRMTVAAIIAEPLDEHGKLAARSSSGSTS